MNEVEVSYELHLPQTKLLLTKSILDCTGWITNSTSFNNVKNKYNKVLSKYLYLKSSFLN